MGNLACSDGISDQLTPLFFFLSWSCSPSSHHLPVINCSYCMRRVGLWGFQQIECVASEPDNTSSTPSTPVPQTSDKKEEKSGLTAVSPRRMVTRSQDIAVSQTEQAEKPPSPVGSRTRSHNSHSPSPLDRPDFDSAGSATRSKRPMTRSMGEVAPTGIEISSSPQRKVKRLRLCSFSTSEVLSSVRNVFAPLSQHKDWCPWVTLTKKQETASPENSANNQCEVIESPQPGWLVVLKVLCSMKSRSSTEGEECMSVPDKSTKVFRIFKQWHAPCSS
ncbi:nuclear-interacting partner of ALK [Protopterus annectens]|uniref:nuclear-interacting partner of ALK n=1 Tax=Protopterus annectens TaxID=7888 RepID=UPI001CFBE8EB|nr:nuclear-interacting partner of ALK [Protopterus annectens]